MCGRVGVCTYVCLCMCVWVKTSLQVNVHLLFKTAGALWPPLAQTSLHPLTHTDTDMYINIDSHRDKNTKAGMEARRPKNRMTDVQWTNIHTGEMR